MGFSAVADRYQSKGFSIMPLRPKDKRPMLPAWAEYQKTRATNEQIEKWKTEFPDGNIAIITGSVSGIVVLDIDGPEGAQSIKDKTIPKTVTAETGNGTHYFFKMPKAKVVGNSVGLLKNVDVRGEGGYIVAPGSTHPNGNSYRWRVECDLDDLEIAECPTWIYEEKKADAPKNNPGWVEALKKGIGKGGRNDACAKLAGHYLSQELNYKPADVVDLLKSWNKNNQPPLGDAEIEATVASVNQKAQNSISTAQVRNVAPIKLDEGKKIISKWLYYKDTTIIDVAAAVVASNNCGSDPIWVIFIGGSSSGKTELLRALDNHNDTCFLDRMTPATLVTGFKKAKGILEKIGSTPKTFVLQDFSTILSKPPYERMEIIDTLRQIYNGTYYNAWGNGKTFSWKGKISLVAGSTPDIEAHSHAIGELGERFLYYRLETEEDSTRKKMMEKARAMEGFEKQAREEITNAIHGIINSCKGKDITNITIDKSMSDWLVDLVDMTTIARSPVKRNSYKRDIIEYQPQKEGPGRAYKQCQVLMKSLALVRGRTKCNEDDYRVVAKVCKDSIPSIRRETLRVLIREQGKGGIRAKDVAQDTGYQSTESIGYHLADLSALGLVDRWLSQRGKTSAFSNNAPYVYEMKKEIKESLENCGLADII